MDTTLVRIYLLPRVPGVTNLLMRDLALSKNTNARAICLCHSIVRSLGRWTKQGLTDRNILEDSY